MCQMSMVTILQNYISFRQLLDRPLRNWNNVSFNLFGAFVALCFKNKQQQVGPPANLSSFLKHVLASIVR